jgi:hypothetical protein
LSVVPGSTIPPVLCNTSIFRTLLSVTTPQLHFFHLQFKLNITNKWREKAPALQIKDLAIKSTGKNIKCVHMASTVENISNSVAAHLHVCNFGTSYKQTTPSADDDIILQVDLLPDKSTIQFHDSFLIWSEVDYTYNGLSSSSYQTSTTVYAESGVNEVCDHIKF